VSSKVSPCREIRWSRSECITDRRLSMRAIYHDAQKPADYA
jgi:hypothetical protein